MNAFMYRSRGTITSGYLYTFLINITLYHIFHYWKIENVVNIDKKNYNHSKVYCNLKPHFIVRFWSEMMKDDPLKMTKCNLPKALGKINLCETTSSHFTT